MCYLYRLTNKPIMQVGSDAKGPLLSCFPPHCDPLGERFLLQSPSKQATTTRNTPLKSLTHYTN